MVLTVHHRLSVILDVYVLGVQDSLYVHIGLKYLNKVTPMML